MRLDHLPHRSSQHVAELPVRTLEPTGELRINMSGTLRINEHDTWTTAGWLFDNVLNHVTRAIEVEEPELARELREGTTDVNGGYVDLSPLPSVRLRNLLTALEGLRTATAAQGPSSFHAPEFFDGYVTQMNLLIDMVRRDKRMTPP